MLIEWKAWTSNVHHSDSDPLKLDFELKISKILPIDAKIRFFTSNGKYFEGELIDLKLVSIDSDLIFLEKEIYPDCINVSLLPSMEGIHTISASLYGYILSKTFDVSKIP